MTVVSTPACSSRMAAVWRRTCGVTFLAVSDGHEGRGGGVDGDALGEGVEAERGTAAGWKHWIRSGAGCFG